MILTICIILYFLLSITLLFCVKSFRNDFLIGIVIRFTKQTAQSIVKQDLVKFENRFLNRIANILYGVAVILFLIIFFVITFSLLPLISVAYLRTCIKERRIEKERELYKQSLHKKPRLVLPSNAVMGPNYSQIIYLEPSYDSKLNDFFSRHYESINAKLNAIISQNSGYKYEFIFPPISFNSENFQKYKNYNRPDSKDIIYENDFASLVHNFYQSVIENAKLENIDNLKPCFIHLVESGINNNIITCWLN